MSSVDPNTPLSVAAISSVQHWNSEFASPVLTTTVNRHTHRNWDPQT